MGTFGFRPVTSMSFIITVALNSIQVKALADQSIGDICYFSSFSGFGSFVYLLLTISADKKCASWVSCLRSCIWDWSTTVLRHSGGFYLILTNLLTKVVIRH